VEQRHCFRLLYTLHQSDFWTRLARTVTADFGSAPAQPFRIGYAAQGRIPHSTGRCGSVDAGGEREHVELIVADNRYQPKIALRSAIPDPGAVGSDHRVPDHEMIRQPSPRNHGGQDPVHRNRYSATRARPTSPTITRRACWRGHCLSRWAKKHWRNEVDEILLIELNRAGRC